MALNPTDRRARKIVIINSIWSSVYMALTIFALHYTKKIYDVGKCTCLPLIALLALGEGIKSNMQHLIIDHLAPRERHARVRKFNFSNKLKGIAVLFTTIVIYYVVAVLFGAPFLSGHEETFMFSLLLTVLTALPSCLHLGADTTISLLIELTSFEGDIITESIRQSICGTLFGAWLGAIVIPLDWDRPWQVWPIPCSLGSMIGYICSNIFIIMRCFSKSEKIFARKSLGKYGL
ncbi:hypothetical protein RN001_005304 [Aquatica leii]|uniref:Phosphatidylinositol-glycan biosynthesis class F protein n=1 Tax=Aquatica leii TaxID=1421715 RepID=A0AAN7SS15_9COLE|nr:hypothetical protein RN001_005304 [Aquatica leii]